MLFMINLNPRTPKKLNASIKLLIQDLGIDPNLANYLSFINASPSYRNQYCYNNCEAEALRGGGDIVYGWIIWEDRKKQFVEAEHHCVMRKGGSLMDITPRQNRRDTKVLFVPDDTRCAGRIDNNTWHSWSNHKSMGGEIVEPTVQLRVTEIDKDYCEIEYLG